MRIGTAKRGLAALNLILALSAVAAGLLMARPRLPRPAVSVVGVLPAALPPAAAAPGSLHSARSP